ncbi:MAG: FecR domain-containing protein [Rhodospirillales bacterium]|nr:MAG: FecR domain-containing protein [Rhodospirillales bacterium]
MAGVLLISCLAGLAPAVAAGGHWTLAAVDGTVMVFAPGEDDAEAKRGYPVVVGATVVTGDDGTATLVRRGDSITISPNSEVTIPDTSGLGHLGVVQSLGKLLFRMETRDSYNFEVRTPFLAATVKGTVFTVEVAQNQATVSVDEGMVRVVPARGGRSDMVRAGYRASVTAARSNEVAVENVSGRGGSPATSAGGRGKGNAGGDRGSSGNRGGNSKGVGAKGGGPNGGGPNGGGSNAGGAGVGGSPGDDSQGDDSQDDDAQDDQQ